MKSTSTNTLTTRFGWKWRIQCLWLGSFKLLRKLMYRTMEHPANWKSVTSGLNFVYSFVCFRFTSRLYAGSRRMNLETWKPGSKTWALNETERERRAQARATTTRRRSIGMTFSRDARHVSARLRHFPFMATCWINNFLVNYSIK